MSAPASTTNFKPNDIEVKKKSKNSPIIIVYLVHYNIISAMLWSGILYNIIKTLYTKNGDYTKVYSNALVDLWWVQSLAIIEVFHSLFGIVRAPVSTTLAQVYSRLFLAVFVLYFFPAKEAITHWGLTTMTIGWSLAEIIRYIFYAFTLINYVPNILLWIRYSAFYILYPVGASSEVIVAYHALPLIRSYSEIYYYLSVFNLCLWPLGFYILFSHMLKQRSKVLYPKVKSA